MRRHIEEDHLIASLLFVVLLCVVKLTLLSEPAVTAAEPLAAPTATPTARPTPTDIPFNTPTATPSPMPTPTRLPTATARSLVVGCDEPFRLAGALDAEGRSQPDYVRMAIAAIVVIEARSRGMNVCELTERTHFLSVWHYAQQYPDSWHAQQFAQPSQSSLQIASNALASQYNDLRGGAMHFDGAWWADDDWQCRPEVLWRGGTTCFYP